MTTAAKYRCRHTTTACQSGAIAVDADVYLFVRDLIVVQRSIGNGTDILLLRLAHPRHVSLGIYALLFLLMMSLTGPIFSFQWYRSTATALGGGEQQELFKHDKHGHPDKKDLQMKPQQVTVMQADQNAQMPQGKLPLQVVFNQIHTGSIGGLLLRILYFLAAIIGGLLPWSGYYMWWKHTHLRKKSSSII